MTDEESDMFEIKKGTKQGDLLSSFLLNIVLQVALKDDFPRWQKKKRNGHLLRRLRVRLPQKNCDLLTRCSCLQLQKSNSNNDGVTSNIAQKRWNSRYIQKKTKILSSRSSSRRKEMEIDDIRVGTLTREESKKIVGPDDNVPATGDDRGQESNQGCLGDVSQMQTRVDLKILLLRHWFRFFDMVLTPTMNYASHTWTSQRT